MTLEKENTFVTRIGYINSLLKNKRNYYAAGKFIIKLIIIYP